MSVSRRRVKLCLIADAIPRSLKTIYNAHCEGRIAWASRLNNEGRKTRHLWADLDGLEMWAGDEGLALNHKIIGEAEKR